MNTKTKTQVLLRVGIAIAAILLLSGVSGGLAYAYSTNRPVGGEEDQQTAEEIEQLNNEIEQRKQRIKEVEQKKSDLEQQLNIIQRQSYSIQNHIKTIDTQITDTEFEIEKQLIEMEERQLEIERLSKLIDEKQQEVQGAKDKLAELIQLMDENDRTNQLFVLFSRESFSSFMDELRSTADMQLDVQGQVQKLKDAKQTLEEQKSEQEKITKQLEEEKASLERNKETLDQQRSYQQQLYADSKSQEKPFEELLAQFKREEDYANAQVQALENAIHEKLLSLNQGLISNENVPLAWPVMYGNLNAQSCAAKITCTATFYDSDYEGIFQRKHYGVDIPVSQGSPVYAPADGYVVGVIHGFAGGGVGSLSVLTINHTDASGIVTNMTTKYLHMSNIIVRYDPNNPQFVRQGELIGYSGGMPGTKGAGTRWQSTGPHLHFEVRMDGLAVNPLNYLP